jgi:hypothetical protein
MQSGFLRGGFGDKKNKKTGTRDRHTTPVMGVAVDGLNRTVMTGAYDGIVKVKYHGLSSNDTVLHLI